MVRQSTELVDWDLIYLGRKKLKSADEPWVSKNSLVCAYMCKNSGLCLYAQILWFELVCANTLVYAYMCQNSLV